MRNFQKITVCFFLGALSIQLLGELPSAGVLVFLTLLSIVAFKWASSVSIICMDFVWAAGYALVIDSAYLSSHLESNDILLQGDVIGLPATGDKAIQFLFKVDRDSVSIKDQSFPNNIRLNWYEKGRLLKSGERWQLLVKLKRPHGYANPHGYDYERWLFQNEIGATGYVRQSVDNKRLKRASYWAIGYRLLARGAQELP